MDFNQLSREQALAQLQAQNRQLVDLRSQLVELPGLRDRFHRTQMQHKCVSFRHYPVFEPVLEPVFEPAVATADRVCPGGPALYVRQMIAKTP